MPWARRAEAVTLAVDWHDGHWWLLFAPDVWVRPSFIELPNGLSPEQARKEAEQLAAGFVRERVARRYNKMTGALLGAWLRLLTAGGSGGTRTVHAYGLNGAGMDATFTFGSQPLVSRPMRGNVLRSNT